jgi:peptidoglycan-associated lipoprotein
MKKFNRTLLSLAVFALALGACSKKTKDDTDTAAGDEMAVTDLASGKPLSELGAVYFEFDSFSLTSESRSILDRHVQWLQSNSSVKVQVEGHCDERGTTEYNLALGDRRAGSVREYLISKGVTAARVQTISYGEERPVSTGSTEMAWAQNRRAEFVSAGQ